MEVDAFIVGAGMIGSALGCALAKSSRFSRLAVLDTAPIPQPLTNEPPQAQVITISPITHKFFKSIDSWDLITDTRRKGFRGMKVWDYYGTGYLDFPDSFGWVLENRMIQYANMSVLQSYSNVKLLAPNKIKQIRRRLGHIEVELENGDVYHTPLIIGSDGRESPTRKWIGLNTWGWDYPHCGLVSTVRTTEPLTEAQQRFLKTGPIALLPLWDNYINIIWSLPPDIAQKMKALSPEEYLQALNSAISDPSPVEFPIADPIGMQINPPYIAELVSDRFTFPYKLQHATSYVEARCAVLGDAAHTVHPMAGQGLNLGIYDAINMGSTLCNAVDSGDDVGSLIVLRKYEQATMYYNTMIALFEEGLLYANSDVTPLNYLRNANYSLISNLTPLRDIFQKVANGEWFVPSKWPWVGSIPEADDPLAQQLIKVHLYRQITCLRLKYSHQFIVNLKI